MQSASRNDLWQMNGRFTEEFRDWYPVRRSEIKVRPEDHMVSRRYFPTHRRTQKKIPDCGEQSVSARNTLLLFSDPLLPLPLRFSLSSDPLPPLSKSLLSCVSRVLPSLCFLPLLCPPAPTLLSSAGAALLSTTQPSFSSEKNYPPRRAKRVARCAKYLISLSNV